MGSSHWRWHLDEVFVKVNGLQNYLWRAVDHEGEVLEAFVSKTRAKEAALCFLEKLMKRHKRAGEFVNDGLRSYEAALRDFGAENRQAKRRWANNRTESSHQPFRRRERAMLRFRRMHSLQMFADIHYLIHNLFNAERHLSSRQTFKLNRAAAPAEWRGLGAIRDQVHRPNLRLVRIRVTAPLRAYAERVP